ncbi:MAG: threonine synthase [Sulfolobales archaeon]
MPHYLTGFICPRCGARYEGKGLYGVCRSCGGPLLAIYDLEAVRVRLDRRDLERRGPSMWRYRELLPVGSEENIVSLGEGSTPLIKLERISKELGLEVYLKDESRNPTGSFKDRAISATISALKEIGVRSVAMPTAGNAGASLAAYAARAGFKAYIAMPKDTPRAIYAEISIRGIDLSLVDGLISDAAKLVSEGSRIYGWIDVSTMKTPYRVEGTKTMAYEIAEQLRWRTPDAIIFPTGGGEGIVGMWKGFEELRTLGWIDEIPRLIAVQSSGCKPIVDAYERGAPDAEYYSGCTTLASGIRVPKPFGDREILRAIRETKGYAIAVSDQEIVDAMKKLASIEGILPCPEGAASYAALLKLVERGFLSRGETIVIFNSGSALKYFEVISNLARVV